MNERRCILHAGTHKTGTTSLQVFFQENLEAFRAAGLHVTQAGRHRMLPGNHELAWELLDGTSGPLFAQTLAELQACSSRAALLTSEDFSLLYARPHVLASVARELQRVGYRTTVVFYLRAQAAYVESMYVERIKHGYVRPLADYLGRIVETGHYLPDGTQQNLQFCYTRLIEPFARAFGGENVVVRAYVPANDLTALFRDALSVLCAVDPQLQQRPMQLRASSPRANASLSFGTLLETLARQTCGTPASLELLRGYAAELTPERLRARFALVRREESLQLLRRFADDNRELERRYGVRIPFVTPADVAPASDPLWAQTDFQRTLFDRCLSAWTTCAST